MSDEESPEVNSADESMSDEEASDDEVNQQGEDSDGEPEEPKPNGKKAGKKNKKNGVKRESDSDEAPIANKKKKENSIDESLIEENGRRVLAMSGNSLFVEFPDTKKEQLEKLGGVLDVWSSKTKGNDVSVSIGMLNFDTHEKASEVLEKLATFGLDDDITVRANNRGNNRTTFDLKHLKIEKIPAEATIVDVAAIVPDCVEIRIRSKTQKGKALDFKDASVTYESDEAGKKAFLDLAKPSILESPVFVVFDTAVRRGPFGPGGDRGQGSFGGRGRGGGFGFRGGFGGGGGRGGGFRGRGGGFGGDFRGGRGSGGRGFGGRGRGSFRGGRGQ